ncbi:hypothetical protein GOBAR_AA11256 [Gossypium barbadense]|uniref:Uncharacterized protein n=1 Tax=Gossypium barbadense TaxID=3634 RepID=A0A2P5Y1B7_GOSBA|nr:hypothetical protein GOBAR_AA11256 [Gossypium barbadense]
MSETRFQNSETALKNQQASIQELETQIGQLSKLISKRPQGVIELESEPRQETVVSEGRDEVDQNTNKPVTIEYKPRVPYPNTTRKDCSDKQFGELTLRVGDNTITLQARNSGITSNIEGHIHEKRRPRIEELDEWRAHKPRTHAKPKLRQNKPDTSPNQLKIGDKVLLDAADAHIVTTTPNEEVPLMVLSIFPFSTVEVIHSKFSTFKHTRPDTRVCLKPWPNKGIDTAVRYGHVEAGHDFLKTRDAINPHSRSTWPWVNLIDTPVPLSRGQQYTGVEELFQILRAQPLTTGRCIDWATVEQVQLADAIRALLSIDPWERFFAITEPTYLELTLELCYTFHLQLVITNNDDPGTIHFRLGGLVRAMSVPEFGVALGLYTDDRLKASTLAPSLRYLHAILAHTLTGRRENTGFINTHDAYYLWCMVNVHVTDLAYFISFAIRHQTGWHWKGVISISPYVTGLARHFSLLNTVAQSSALTLIGQMSPQGITTMLHMRMIERQRGTDPPQYHLTHAIDEEDLEDIPEDVPL